MSTSSPPGSCRGKRNQPFLNDGDGKNERSLVTSGGLRLAPLTPPPALDRQVSNAVISYDLAPARTQWPSAAPADSRKATSARASKAPLALQLEAFIRREYRQYLDEHPDCTRKDTIHIFREGLNAFIDHFAEYNAVLHLIQDEYDATLGEYASDLRTMRANELEGRSNRSIHAMELMQMKETLNATISNQQTQLKASEAIIHSLREQLAAAEHANSLLRFEMEKRFTEHDEAKQKVTLLAKSLIDESARTAAIIESSKQKDRDMELQEARIKVLNENVQELEEFLRESARARVFAPDKEADASVPSTAPRVPHRGNVPSTDTLHAEHVESTETRASQYTDEYVHKLLANIDALAFEISQRSGASQESGGVAILDESQADARHTSSEHVQRSQRVGNVRYPVIEEWLREEAILDADLEASEVLVPPGLWATEPFAFLGGCRPVRDRHLALRETRRLVDLLWQARELERGSRTRLQPFFTEWLRSQTGTSDGVKELGLNLLRACERFIWHPDCRMLLLCLRGFLPDAAPLTCRRLIQQVFKACQTNLECVAGTMPMQAFFDVIRHYFPEMSHVHVLRLRFHAFRQRDEAGCVNVERLLSTDSYFVTLLTSQFCTEVELFTLGIVEGVRAVSDAVKGTVGLNKAMKVMRSIDPGMSEETLHTYFSAATQKPMIDIATADHTVAVRVESLLSRFRTSVLLRRSTPSDLPDIGSVSDA